MKGNWFSQSEGDCGKIASHLTLERGTYGVYTKYHRSITELSPNYPPAQVEAKKACAAACGSLNCRMNLELVRVQPHQAEALQALARSTFIDTFAADNTPENLNAYLAKAYHLEQIAAELRDPGIEYWFGTHAGKPIGFLMLKLDSSYEKLEGTCTEIQRIYVVKEHLGSGAGKVLFDFGVKRAEELGSRWLWLGVWKSNHRAVRFYQKQGMEIVGEQIFPMGDDPQEDWVMARRVDHNS